MAQTKVQERRSNSRPVNYKNAVLSVGTDGKLSVNTDSRKISGYAAIFGNVDDAGDIIIKGAFAKSISERGPGSASNRKIILLWQHDIDEPLGRITLLEEDSKGLYFEAEIDTIPEGDRLINQLNSGTINQFSIGYQYIWDKVEYDEANDALLLKEVNLYEISAVSIACNGDTEFLGMKAQEIESEHNKHNRNIEKVLKEIPDYALQYKVRQLISKSIALAEAGEPVVKPLTETVKPPPEQETININNLKLI